MAAVVVVVPVPVERLWGGLLREGNTVRLCLGAFVIKKVRNRLR